MTIKAGMVVTKAATPLSFARIVARSQAALTSAIASGINVVVNRFLPMASVAPMGIGFRYQLTISCPLAGDRHETQTDTCAIKIADE